MTMRVALYWAPERTDPLHDLGSRWLGRDAESGASLPQPVVDGVDMAAVTAEARHYGLHATLKPPFAFSAAWQDILSAARDMAAAMPPFTLPPLQVRLLDGFLALREAEPCPALQDMADRCVEALDRFRLPPSEAELARRLRQPLTDAQRVLLDRWGYPYVKQEWRFHVTLSRRLQDGEAPPLQAAAEAWLAQAAGRPRLVREVCLFTQATAGAPFLLAERLSLGSG